MASDAGWRAELEAWLRPFPRALAHPARRAMCPLHVAGLIGPGERKGVRPMAERLGLPGHGALHHFVAAGVWDAEPLEAAPAQRAPQFAPLGLHRVQRPGLRPTGHGAPPRLVRHRPARREKPQADLQLRPLVA